MKTIELLINGATHEVTIEPDESLLQVLRNRLDLIGTKKGCDSGGCGCCSIQVDGKVVYSCMMYAVGAAGKSITTIEGLSEKGDHPVQQAWLEHDVAQCGYCQAGQIMTAVSLLKTNPKPSDKQIDEAMSGNICRCGTYPRIHDAVKLASKRLTLGVK